MFESRPGVVCVGEAAGAVDVGRGVTVEAELSTDGGKDSFLLFLGKGLGRGDVG